jgi:opacity protein-like surface antigen
MKRIFLGFTLALIALSSYASNVDFYLMGGPAFTRMEANNSISLNGLVTNDYNNDSKWYLEPLLGIGIGHTFTAEEQPFNLSLALSEYFTNYDDVTGTEYPFSNVGSFDTLNYRYHSQTYATLFETRISYTDMILQPYILGGIGGAFNRLNGYTEFPANASLSAAAAKHTFDGHTDFSFSYELGVGLQKNIYYDRTLNIQYLLSLDYRYLAFGAGEFGPASTQTTNQRMGIDNLSTQAVILSLKLSV